MIAGQEAAPGHESSLGVETAALVLLFATVVSAVDPRGNFPLNDDWNFALATWWLADHGEFRFARFTGMSLRAQMVWGAGWTLMFGKSFEILRYSTLALSLLTLLLFHRLCALAGMARYPRVLASVGMLAFPLFMWSSFTYMTQIPFLFASMVAIYCWLRGLARRSIGWFLGGTLAVLVSCFVRQSGVATLVAGGAALAWMWRESGPRFRNAALSSLAAALGIFIALITMTDLLAGRSEEFGIRFRLLDQSPLVMVERLLSQAVENGAFVLVYAVLGMIALSLPGAFEKRSRREVALMLFLSLPVVWGTAALASRFGLIPYERHGNVIAGWSFGPHTLRDTWIFHLEKPGSMSLPMRISITITGVLVAASALFTVARHLWSSRSEARDTRGLAAVLGAGLVAGGVGILATTSIVFDRYALDAGWPVALVLPLLTLWTPARRRLAALLVGLTLLFSVGATSDYLAWNRARWEAFDRLRARGVTLDRMDGGYEINQYLVGGFDGPALLVKQQFSVVDDEWILAFNESVPGYESVEAVPWRRWSGSGAIHILKRVGVATAPTGAGR